jgi:outer membrane protein OmpA-like peptidoglycan-associated protein
LHVLYLEKPMKTGFLSGIVGLALAFTAPVALSQRPPSSDTAQHEGSAPIYQITVVERTAKAVNYEYRSDPTRVDLRGTVLLPQAKGDAMVRSRQGRTEIDAKLDHLVTPQRFGGEYLTYVLWAITPQGRPHNIGELIPDSGDTARVHVTTDLKAFALLVTAEPYAAVRQPSDVVVAENQIRPDTVGKVEPVEAKYELLPRGAYTWRVPSQLSAAVANAPKVSMHEYEALLELYQAENAVGTARTANAERYAPDVFARAQQQLAQAQQLHDHKANFRRVVESAREAAQTAEDSRVLARQRQQQEHVLAADAALVKTQADLANAQQARQQALDQAQQAQSQAQRAQADADAARAQAQAALTQKSRAESEAAAARARDSQTPYHAEIAAVRTDRGQQLSPDQRARRSRLLVDLNGILRTLDTGRGIVVTVPDEAFRGGATIADSKLAQIGRMLSQTPGLSVTVEGYSDAAAKQTLSQERAESVRRILVANGLSPRVVTATGLGDSRPIGPNSSAESRKANSRVEIVISGEPVGELPLWEQTSPIRLSSPSPGNRD